MISPANRPTRRQFLERSALGAGGLLFSSGLLASCTDHQINPPGDTPIIRPPVGGVYMNPVDWSDAAKAAVTTGLRMTPAAGEILGALVDVFWPDQFQQDKVWNQVKANMEDFVGQKIGSSEYELVNTDLNNFASYLWLYLFALNYNSSNGEKLNKWQKLSTAFADAQSHFQAPGNELPLLPFFTQFANMYLAVLRDGVLHGSAWGMTPAELAQNETKLTKLIQEFSDYVTTTHKNYHDYLKENTRLDYENVEPFRTYNKFDRQMAFWVLDFRDTWPYYQAGQYPLGSPNLLLTREIYSDPYGQGAEKDQPFAISTIPGATQRPTQLEVWSDQYFNALRMTYPLGSGPGKVTRTPILGYSADGDYHPPYLIPAEDPFINVTVTYSNVVNALQFFHAYNNRSTGVLGNDSQGNSVNLGYNYEAISSAYIQGFTKIDDNTSAANVIVIGFQYWLSPQATLQAIGNLYIKSPQERSAAEFARAFPKLGITATSISAEVKAARQTYWAALQARAEKLK